MFGLIYKNNSLSPVERLMEQAWNWDDFFPRASKSMETDIIETEKGYLFKIDMPSVKKENINITYENNYITIKASESTQTENKKYLMQERSFKEYSRSFYAPGLDENSITARLEDGVLNIEVGKAEKPAIKRIEIQ